MIAVAAITLLVLTSIVVDRRLRTFPVPWEFRKIVSVWWIVDQGNKAALWEVPPKVAPRFGDVVYGLAPGGKVLGEGYALLSDGQMYRIMLIEGQDRVLTIALKLNPMRTWMVHPDIRDYVNALRDRGLRFSRREHDGIVPSWSWDRDTHRVLTEHELKGLSDP